MVTAKIIKKIFTEIRTKIFLFKIQSKNDKNCRVMGKVSVKTKNIKIGKNVTIYPNVTFWGSGLIVIGDNVAIGDNTMIFSSKVDGGVYIGNDVLIAANCYIIDCDHGFDKNRLIREQELSSEPIHIGDDVWISENCSILKGSIIKNGAVIGAKSLVNSKIDSYSIAVGVPAKVIKYRK